MAGWWTAFDKKLDSIVEFVEQQQSSEPLNELKDMLYQCTADMAEMKAKQENMIVDMDKVWTDMKNDQEDISERCALLEDLLKIMSKELARKPLTPAVPPQLHASRAADAHCTPRGRPAGSHDDPTPAAVGQGSAYRKGSPSSPSSHRPH